MNEHIVEMERGMRRNQWPFYKGHARRYAPASESLAYSVLRTGETRVVGDTRNDKDKMK